MLLVEDRSGPSKIRLNQHLLGKKMSKLKDLTSENPIEQLETRFLGEYGNRIQ